jgi:hypothetical protein
MSFGRETRPIKAHHVRDLSISRTSQDLRTFISGTIFSSSDATLYLNIETTLIYRECHHFFGSALLYAIIVALTISFVPLVVLGHLFYSETKSCCCNKAP